MLKFWWLTFLGQTLTLGWLCAKIEVIIMIHTLYIVYTILDTFQDFLIKLGIKPLTLDSGINVGVRLLIFGLFSSGYMLIKWFFFYFFLLFFFVSLGYVLKNQFICHFKGGYAYSRGYIYCFCQMFQGLCLFKGVRLFRSLEYAVNSNTYLLSSL